MIRIYIASPYSIGDKLANVNRSLDAADTLMRAGYAPYAPLLKHYHQELYPHTHEEWLEQDFAWVSACDILLRLPGESAGADKEVAFAKRLDLPIYHSIDDLIRNVKP